MRDALLARGGATEAEISPWAPGGAENADRGLVGWIEFWGHLKYLHGVETERDGAMGERKEAKAAATALAALRRQPIPIPGVTLAGAPLPLQVHPKGALALTEVALLDWLLGWFVAVGGVGERHQRVDLQEDAARGQVRTHAILVWILTHPGPGMPYPAYTAPPDPPLWALQLDPVDLLSVLAAHKEVNGGRLACLELLTHGRGGPRVSWAAIVAADAERAHSEAYRLMAETTMVERLVQSGLANEVDRLASEDRQRAPRGLGLM